MSRISQAAVRALAVVLLAGTVLSAACTYTDPDGRQHSLTPYRDRPTSQWVVLTRFTDPETGEVYELIDTNGDGKVDIIRRVRDGRLLQPDDPFKPSPTPTPKPAQPTTPGQSVNPTTQAPLPPPGGGGNNNPQDDDYLTWPQIYQLVRTGFANNDSATAGWEHFNFGNLSAGEWLHAVGLDVPAGTTIHVDNVRMPVVQYELGQTDGYTEAVIMWSGDFHMPRIASRGLDYRIDTRTDPDNRTFVVIRLHGSATQVIQTLAEMGSLHLSYRGDGDERWDYTRFGNACLISVNGSVVRSVPLD